MIEGSGLEVFQIYVNRFSVGKLESGGCVGGYLQILDSEYDSVNEVHLYLRSGEFGDLDIIDVQALGFHCGEAEQPKQIIRETKKIKLRFIVDEYNWNAEWDFRVEAVTKTGVPGRFGSHPERFPGKVGAVVEQTYCETVFQDCRAQQCNVQSPGFPGVYPQGINCR